ncbi:hypothetical protein ThesiDRAFT1_1369 [Thermoanaerobacter siderophilus SR4]|uniref:Uncharacterized protein n=1 Tax=Thermoanaerobacter siderophilus SR4 TaxID=880478 RepID=I8QYW0_9THEO|nr:hypothetical protein ThesiDRAFT1_1369 [Thermoanaerobacter siderophilus SR4]
MQFALRLAFFLLRKNIMKLGNTKKGEYIFAQKGIITLENFERWCCIWKV